MALFFRDPESLSRVAASHGISIRAICDRAEVAQTTFYRWLRGESSPTIKTAEQLGEALEELIAETRRHSPAPQAESLSG